MTLLPGPDGEARYGYLDTIREYALEQLTEAGTREAVELAHARFFTEFAEIADRGLRGSGQQGWSARIASDNNNIRAATRWLLDHEQPALASRIATAMWWYWDVHGDLAEGRRWIEEALEAETTPSGRSLLLNGLGCLSESQRDLGAATAALTEALAIRRSQGDEVGIAVVLNNLGIAHRDAGEAEASEAACASRWRSSSASARPSARRRSSTTWACSRAIEATSRRRRAGTAKAWRSTAGWATTTASRSTSTTSACSALHAWDLRGPRGSSASRSR